MDPTPTPRSIVSALARLPRALPWLGLGLVLCFVHLVRPGVLESVDFVRFHALNQEYLWGAIRAGRLPLWNPHVALGRPFLADIETAFFYPPYWIHLLLSPRTAVCVLLTLHSALGLWSLTALARAVGVQRGVAVALAVLFFASGTVIQLVSAGQVLYYAGICYLPWALLASLGLHHEGSRRAVARLGGILSLQLLATHPQVFWMTCVACLVLLLARALGRPWRASLRGLARPLLAHALAMGLAVAVAAVQLLPFAELIGNGNRQARTVDFASAWSLPPRSLASLAYIVPSGNWSDNLYAGSVLALAGMTGLLCVRGRSVRGLAVLAGLGIVVALGTATPAFWLAFNLLPGLSFFRIPGRMALFTLLAAVLAAGLLLTGTGVRRRAGLVAALVSVGAIAAALLDPMGRDAVPSLVRAGALACVGALLIGWLVRRPSSRRALLAMVAAVAAITSFELYQGGRVAKAMVAAPAAFPVEAEVAQVLAKQGLLADGVPPPRVSLPFPAARENAGLHYGWSTFTGYVGLWLGRTWSYVHTAAGLQVPTTSVAFPASNVYRSAFPYDGVSLVLGIDPATGQGGLRAQADPRAYVVDAVRVVPDWHVAIEAMAHGHDYHRVALIEEPLPDLPLSGNRDAGTARIVSFAPERIELETQSQTAGLLVMAESYYPGWSATVNGQPSPCLAANAWMRAVPVPAGTSRVVLVFRSSYLGAGAVVSALALLLLLALARSRSREPKAPATSSSPPSPAET